MMRKYLLIAMALVLMSGNALAEDDIIGGDCSKTTDDHCSWSLNTTTGELIISGTGEMADYATYDLYLGTEKWRAPGWYDYREQITSIDIENGITSIGSWAFEKTNISKIALPESVEKIDEYAFHRAQNLTEVNLPSSLKTISNKAFYLAHNLQNIEIPESVSDLYFGAFAHTALNSLVIPPSVTILQDIFSQAIVNKQTFSEDIVKQLTALYCPNTPEIKAKCEELLQLSKKDFKPTIYEKQGHDYLVYDDKGNIVGKYASVSDLKGKKPAETYKYDSAGHLVGIFDGNGQRTWGKKIYTVEEAMEATKDGDKFHVYLTYK